MIVEEPGQVCAIGSFGGGGDTQQEERFQAAEDPTIAFRLAVVGLIHEDIVEGHGPQPLQVLPSAKLLHHGKDQVTL